MRTFAAQRFFVSAALLALASNARAQQPDSRGEILVGQSACVACHDASPAARDRVAPLRAPKTGVSGLAITPQWLRAFLDDPQKIEPGSFMPDMLANLSGQERTDAIEALTHYLVSFHTNSVAAADAVRDEIERGRALYHRCGCVACHAPFDPPPGAMMDARVTAEIAKLARESTPLGDLARKTTVPERADFLASPLKAHPAGLMPSLRLTEVEARSVAMYLLRDQVPPATAKSPGLKFEFFNKVMEDLQAYVQTAPDESGVFGDINLLAAKTADNYSLRFHGQITIPKDGEYKFSTLSDDGSWLLIDGKLVVSNAGMHAAEERSGTIVLTAGDHAIDCRYYQGASSSELTAHWEGPGLARQEIPESAYSHSATEMKPIGSTEFKVDEAKAAKGHEFFISLNCIICHPQVGEAGVMSAKTLAELNLKRTDGCLGTNPARGLPKYTFSTDDRDAIRRTLAGAAALNRPLPPAQQLDHAMTALNCYACHARGGRGGPQGFRKEYFVTKSGKPTGDADRIPPPLDGLGAKHDAAWIASALQQAPSAHPDMAARMPLYGADDISALSDEFKKADAR